MISTMIRCESHDRCSVLSELPWVFCTTVRIRVNIYVVYTSYIWNIYVVFFGKKVYMWYIHIWWVQRKILVPPKCFFHQNLQKSIHFHEGKWLKLFYSVYYAQNFACGALHWFCSIKTFVLVKKRAEGAKIFGNIYDT